MVKGSKHRVGRRWAWLASAAVIGMASVAQAQTTYPVAIEASGLEPALLRLASQTGQQILFARGVVAGRKAPPLSGRMTPEAALARLLAGSDLTARRVNAQVVVVERRAGRLTGDGTGDRPFGVEGAAGSVSGRPLGDGAELGAGGSGAGGAPGYGSGVGPAAEPTVVEEVRVTGSNLRGSAPAASPLVVLSRRDLERSGQTTVADALRILPANFTAGPAEGGAVSGADRSGRNSGSATALNLRGLGPNATLVLVNGRRMAGSGLFGDFADLSGIPTAAVQRVEVLLDGASAVYGSDAVGGVVNVILRQNYDDAESRVMAGVGTAGEPVQAQASQVIGRRWDGGGVVLAYELQYREALPAEARDFAGNADLRGLGGSDQRTLLGFPGNILLTDRTTGALAPAFAVPAGQSGVGLRASDLLPGVVNRSNQRAGLDILPRTVVNAGYLAFDQALGDRLTVSGDARVSVRRFRAAIAPPVTQFTVTAANPYFVPVNALTSYAMSYAFVGDLPNPVTQGTAENLGLTLGAKARLGGGWQAEGYAAFAQSIDETRTFGTLNSVFLTEALGGADRPESAYVARRDGYFNPYVGTGGLNSPLALANLSSGFATSRTRNRVATASLQADGPLWRLPGGYLQLAVGAQVRREGLVQDAANFFASATPVAGTPADVTHMVTAGYAELRVPLVGAANARPGVDRLEVSLAGRVEHYEGTGTSFNPKAGLVWAPAPDLRLRGTYGRSFRAPALRETNDLPRYTPTNFPEGAARVQALLLAGGNADLDPERAETFTVGADWTPQRFPGLSINVSAYDIRFKDRIDRPVQANLVNALVDPALAAFVTRISPATNPADRALIQGFLDSGFVSGGTGPAPAEAFAVIVDNRYVNTSSLRLRGLDLAARYQWDVGADQFGLGLQGTYVLDFEQKLTPTSAAVERAGTMNFPVRVRGRATADWSRGAVGLGLAANYTGRYRDVAGTRIDDLLTLDLQARWRADLGPFAGTAALLNVRNLFDKGPPFYDNPLGIAYDGALGDPIGRYVSLQLTKTW